MHAIDLIEINKIYVQTFRDQMNRTDYFTYLSIKHVTVDLCTCRAYIHMSV